MSQIILQTFPQIDAEFDNLPCPTSPFLSHMEGADKVLSELLDGYENFEKTIGYTFSDRSYLLQAFTHASYHFNTVTDCYQRYHSVLSFLL